MPMNDKITIRMPHELAERIDAWIVTQPGYVSRQDAVRRFIDEGLAARGLTGSPDRAGNGVTRSGISLTAPRS